MKENTPGAFRCFTKGSCNHENSNGVKMKADKMPEIQLGSVIANTGLCFASLGKEKGNFLVVRGRCSACAGLSLQSGFRVQPR